MVGNRRSRRRVEDRRQKISRIRKELKERGRRRRRRQKRGRKIGVRCHTCSLPLCRVWSTENETSETSDWATIRPQQNPEAHCCVLLWIQISGSGLPLGAKFYSEPTKKTPFLRCFDLKTLQIRGVTFEIPEAHEYA